MQLDQRLLEKIGDWKQETVTTALTASVVVISTALNKYTGRDDTFNDYYVYIEDFLNAGQDRFVDDYSAASTQITTLGSNFTADTSNATFRVSRFSWANRNRAIIDSISQVFPDVFKPLDDRTLITGNILPNAHFDDWNVSTTPDFYTAVAGTTEASTAVANIRAGSSSVKIIPNASNLYVVIDSDNYPKLLDLMGETVDANVWVFPQVADDPTIVIYTLDNAGSTQTLASTTTANSTGWTLLKLEDQELNDDLVKLEVRFKVASSVKYVYFDNARVTGRNLYEYKIPTAFQNGAISEVFIQTTGYSDDICDDLHPRFWEKVYGWEVESDGTYKYLKFLNTLYSANRQIRLIGYAPLEALSSASDTINLDSPAQLDLLIEYAAYKLYSMESGGVSSADRDHYRNEANRHLGEFYRLLPSHKMIKPRTSRLIRK